MAKDKFDVFLNQYNDSTESLNTIMDDKDKTTPKKVTTRVVRDTAPAEITAEQRQALSEARNARRGRPAVGAVKATKKRIGFEVSAALAEEFKQVSYRTGIPFGQLYEEAMADLVKKYASK